MSILQKYLGTRQAQRQAQQLTAWQRYRELLQRFANGDEVDDNEADAILAVADKSESDLAIDVGTLEKRIQWRQQLADRPKHLAAMEQAEAELCALGAERATLLETLQLKIDAAVAKRSAAEQAIMAGNGAERSLADSPLLDPALTEREQFVRAKLKSLFSAQCDTAEELKKLGLAYLETTLANLKSKSRADFESNHTLWRQHEEKVHLLEQRILQTKPYANRLQQELGDITSEMKTLQAELGEILKAKLKP